jgi:periplasmic copper chaperone A
MMRMGRQRESEWRMALAILAAYAMLLVAVAAPLAHAAAAAPALMAANDKPAPAYTIGALAVSAPWTRATPKGADVAGGYLAITNTGKDADRLVGGSASVAGRFEIHEMATVDGVMKMRHLDKGLEIKPGETVELKPGGFHIMMMGLKTQVKEGDKLKGALVFETAGTLEVEFTAVGVGAGAPAGEHDHAH